MFYRTAQISSTIILYKQIGSYKTEKTEYLHCIICNLSQDIGSASWLDDLMH